MHESSKKLEIRRDPIVDCGVSCPLASAKNPHRFIIGKTVLPLFLGCFDRILFIPRGNNDIHKNLDELDIRQILTQDDRVNRP